MSEPFDSVLRAAQVGAEWAWRRIVREVTPQALGYLRAQGSSDPEGLLGDVFLQVARHVGSFEGDEAAFRSWFFGAVHNRLIDERRRRARRPEAPLSHVAHDPKGGDVEEEALASLATEETVELLNQLTSGQHDVLLLRFFGGLTTAEVAQVLGMRQGAVRALQHRGVVALRKLWRQRTA